MRVKSLGTLNLVDSRLQAFFNIFLSTVLLHKHISHDGVSAPVRLPPLLDCRGHFPSVCLQLELMVDRALGCDFPVVVPADAELFQLGLLFGEYRLAPADGGVGKLLPGFAVDGAGVSDS